MLSKKRYSLIKTILVVVSLTAGASIAHCFLSKKQAGPIYDYDDVRDHKAVKEIFKGDWYWLSNRTWNSDITDFVLRSHSPNEYEPRYYGKMDIKVLRENNELIGFITYYMVNFYEGKILFLAIDKKYRGKRYAEKLLEYAVNDLFKKGASIIQLATRVDNIPAQKLYKRFGFEQVPPWEDDGFIHFAIKQK